MPSNGTLTWLGHAAFRLDTPGGKRVYIDPFLSGSPTCPEAEKEPERVDLILLTHGHDDHVGDTLALAQKFSCPVLAQVELRGWLSTKGLPENMGEAVNKGGTVEVERLALTLTHANHSSSAFDDGAFVYLGESCGWVIELETGFKVYVTGDTNVFGDLELIARIYEPDLVVLPIGDHFTMGPREAAVAIELLGDRRFVPSHYGTFGLLTGTPEKLRELAPGARIESPEPGGSIEL